MQSVNEREAANTQEENTAAEPRTFRKRIGSTTYKVSVHFSKTSNETISDKIRRMIQNEAALPLSPPINPPNPNSKNAVPQNALTAGKEKP